MTLPLTISAETVCIYPATSVLIIDWTNSLTLSVSIAPKFQGENFYKNLAIVEEIKKLATRKGCKISQIALAWVISQGLIPIPGTTKAARLEENWASRDIELTEEEKQEMRKIIDAAKPHGNRYGPTHQAMVGH
jgi:Predicted oxidoreductases (related to aryl-alcohol dehydrogenases)